MNRVNSCLGSRLRWQHHKHYHPCYYYNQQSLTINSLDLNTHTVYTGRMTSASSLQTPTLFSFLDTISTAPNSDHLMQTFQNSATKWFMRTWIHVFVPSFMEICKAEVTKTIHGIYDEKTFTNLSFQPLLRGPWSISPKILQLQSFPTPTLCKVSSKSIQFSRRYNDNDVYFTLATSDSQIGKYKTDGEQLTHKNRSIYNAIG